MSIEERFRAKFVEGEPDKCWLWNAATQRGYGVVGVGRHDDGNIKAHRLSYELNVGPIPDGLHVLHRCDVRACVNPAHLFIGTHADNMADMKAKGRSGYLPQPGESNGRAKLTEADVLEIRRRLGFGEAQGIVAKSFGVHRSTVGRIGSRERWMSL